MKRKTLATLVALTFMVAGCDKGPGDGETAHTGEVAATLETQTQKLSYIFGQNIGSQFKAESMDIDVNVFAQGVRDAISEAEPKLGEDEVMAVLQAFQEEKMAEHQKVFEELSGKNKAEGEAFLAENGAKEDVVTLDSGLQYKIIEEGEGEVPTADSTVEVHYKGTLIDGTEFDSSFKRGVPATFGVNQVIPGWTEALLLMKEGAKWELYIPPSLAYGPGGAGGMIGPEQTLIFEVELLKANAEGEQQEGAAAQE
ncbi:MAG: FKBP-type peptidyl-prolyl cis-trans isomerase [Porticoccaceae bacterium]